jgi:N-acetylglucosamine transport system permease protein
MDGRQAVKPKKQPFESGRVVDKIPHALGKLFVVIWVIFTIIIIGWVIVASFSTTKQIFTNKLLQTGFFLDGYKQLFEQYHILRYFINSIFYTAVACVGLILLCAPAAHAISNYNFPGKKLLMTAYSSAMGLPSVMLLVPLFMIFAKMQMASSVVSLLIIYIGTGIPFTMFYLMAFFSTIPNQIQEAALIDGCSHIRSFWLVIIPLAQPGLLTVTIFNFITYWNEYMWCLTLVNTEEKKSIAVGLQIIVQAMGNTGNYTGLFAAVVCVFVPTFVLFILLSDYIMGDITSGAVKG